MLLRVKGFERGRAGEGEAYIFGLVLLLAQVVLGEEVLVFGSVHVGVLTERRHTTGGSTLCLQGVSFSSRYLPGESPLTPPHSHLHSGTFLGQSGYG